MNIQSVIDLLEKIKKNGHLCIGGEQSPNSEECYEAIQYLKSQFQCIDPRFEELKQRLVAKGQPHFSASEYHELHGFIEEFMQPFYLLQVIPEMSNPVILDKLVRDGKQAIAWMKKAATEVNRGDAHCESISEMSLELNNFIDGYDSEMGKAFKLGEKSGVKRASSILRKKSGELFMLGKDKDATWCRDMAEMLKKESEIP